MESDGQESNFIKEVNWGRSFNEAVTSKQRPELLDRCVKIQGTRVSGRGNNKFKAPMKNEESILYLRNRQQGWV